MITEPDQATVSVPNSNVKNCALAIISLACGVSAFVFVPFLGAVTAIITGHLGLHQIKKSDGKLTGKGMATAGLVLGYTQIGMTLLIFILVIVMTPALLNGILSNFFNNYGVNLY
jgi:hypothetical protein